MGYFLGTVIGLQRTFFWILVVLMSVNAAFVSLLYRPYLRDTAALRDQIEAQVAGRPAEKNPTIRPKEC
ncbi:hypothetical protein [Nocardia sp.]|uniref:hypothetical protein n=1 Tax=Nocardia sp. TaxID=1821 RepID=UPI00260DA62E|nr:hypothetical protein [Nocardia sp.]